MDIEEFIVSTTRVLKTTFMTSFSKAMASYKQLEYEQRKGSLAFVYISFLRTHILTHQPCFQINLYDNRNLRDLVECCELWDTSSVIKQIYEQHPFPSNILSITGKAECVSIEKKWLTEADVLVMALQSHMPQIIESARQTCEPSVIWNYGEYYGATIEIPKGAN